MSASVKRGFAAGSGSLTTAYSGIKIGTDPAAQGSADILNSCHLSLVRCALTNILGGASQVIFYLSGDAAGDVPISQEVTRDIVFGQTTGKGGIAADATIEHVETDQDAGQAIWLWARLNVGSADIAARIIYRG